MKRTIIVLLAGFLMNAAPARAQLHTRSAFADCPGKMDNVEVHAGPQSSTRVLQTLKCGEQVTVIGKADGNDWFKVKTRQGVQGYVWMFLSDPQSAKTKAETDDSKDQLYAAGFNTGEGPDGGSGVELIATIIRTTPVHVVDQVGNAMIRELVTFRLDFQGSAHKEWLQMICLHQELGESKMDLKCNTFAAGRRYRLVASRSGSLIEFHPVKQRFPSFLYQGWKRCSDSLTNCYRIADHPIHMVRLATGEIER